MNFIEIENKFDRLYPIFYKWISASNRQLTGITDGCQFTDWQTADINHVPDICDVIRTIYDMACLDPNCIQYSYYLTPSATLTVDVTIAYGLEFHKTTNCRLVVYCASKSTFINSLHLED